MTAAQVWHPEVTVYDVYDKSKLIGRIYFDMFPRENKYKHYATFTLATGKNGFRLPEYVLVCNFPKAAGGPGLMERDDVITFFHEFGHLIHGIMKGNTKWAEGDLENDFIEAPSQMFEEWPKDPAILKLFARHYKTNEPIPAELAEKARAADDFGRALNVRTQMFYAAISLDFYNRDPQGLDTDKLVAQLQERYTPFKYVEGTHMHTAFGHLNNYSAVYYTYMWSLVIAKDMFTEFKKDGLLNPEVAAKYRDDGSGRQRHQTSRRTGARFSGTPVFVPGLRRLAERKVEASLVGLPKASLVLGRWSLAKSNAATDFADFHGSRHYSLLLDPCKSVKSVADVVLPTTNDQRPTTTFLFFPRILAAHTPAPASSDPAGDR